jgi:hypothetical protein
MLAYPIFIPYYTSGCSSDLSGLEAILIFYWVISFTLCSAHLIEVFDMDSSFNMACALTACIIFGWLMLPFVILYRLFCFFRGD